MERWSEALLSGMSARGKSGRLDSRLQPPAWTFGPLALLHPLLALQLPDSACSEGALGAYSRTQEHRLDPLLML